MEKINKPEEEIQKYKKVLFTQYNLYNLLKLLRDSFPVWLPEEFIIKRMQKERIIFNDIEMERLKVSGLLECKDFNNAEIGKSCRISLNGVEFLNSMETQKLNRKMFIFTVIIIVIGIIQIGISLLDLFKIFS